MIDFKKIPYIDRLPIVILAILSYMVIMNYKVVLGAAGTFFGVLTPFVWGFAIAFLLNPLVNNLEKKLKIKRVLAVVLTYLILIVVILVIFTQLVPQVFQDINQFVNALPNYSDRIVKLFTTYSQMLIDYLRLDPNAANIVNGIKLPNLDQALQGIGGIGNLLGGLIGGVIGFASGVANIFIGLIVSLYVLLDKKKFKTSLKKALYAILTPKLANSLLSITREAKMLFSKYLIGQALDSTVVGIIAVIGFSILGTPYSLLMGILLGFSNMIPFFGPIIGAVPIVLITLLSGNFMLAVYTLIFILVLQQIDGNILSPNIVGGSLGVTPFWSIMAILIGGSLFGILGMIICIPGFALIRNMFVRWVDGRIEKKKQNDEPLPEGI